MEESEEQIAAILEGISYIVPAPLFRFMTGDALETWICGKPEIDLNLLQKIVRYRDMDKTHYLVVWFWRIVGRFTNEDRVALMRWEICFGPHLVLLSLRNQNLHYLLTFLLNVDICHRSKLEHAKYSATTRQPF